MSFPEYQNSEMRDFITAWLANHPTDIPDPKNPHCCQWCGKPVPTRPEYLRGDADPICDECWMKGHTC